MALSVSIDLVSSSARVTSVKFQKHHVRTDGHPDPKIGPQVYLGPIKITAFMEFLGIFLIADFPKHIVCKHTNIANHRGITEVAEEGVSNVIDGKHTEETELQSRC